MENQIVRRRLDMIASHFAASDEILANPISPMSCNGGINSTMRRYDNRMYFARQGSASQAYFMRQASVDQRLAQTGVLPKCTNLVNEGSPNSLQGPLFSRPGGQYASSPSVGVTPPESQDCKLLAPDPPMFAQPKRRMDEYKQFRSQEKLPASATKGSEEWSPRTDIAESGCNYVVIVELPGVAMKEIRVEVTQTNLVVTGKRSIQWWQEASSQQGSMSAYHKKEIMEGPYQVTWPLPANANKDRVSAEFVEGLLQITIPKV
ncbi:Alpha crystallin/Hsp20 domain [Dillenia turbinata]|uniref:Alpha crystallin/Hsp20 domain n=1 Tax=Dillenia turbinata TaxID=194707 RepID=A0AAN8Z182_9MAGN